MTQKNRLFLLWGAVALLFGGLLAWAEHSRNRLDDPDPALQRRGQLLPADTVKAPALIPGFPRRGHRLVVLFARSVAGTMLFHDLAMQSDLSVMADVILVTADGSHPTITHGLVRILPDPEGRIVRAFGLNMPLDGGYPVGYAIVDRHGFLRYQTLDPHCMVVMGSNTEIKTMLRATP